MSLRLYGPFIKWYLALTRCVVRLLVSVFAWRSFVLICAERFYGNSDIAISTTDYMKLGRKVEIQEILYVIFPSV